VSRALAAFERGDFSAAIDALEPIAGKLERIPIITRLRCPKQFSRAEGGLNATVSDRRSAQHPTM
jgi:hypothetical protein